MGTVVMVGRLSIIEAIKEIQLFKELKQFFIASSQVSLSKQSKLYQQVWAFSILHLVNVNKELNISKLDQSQRIQSFNQHESLRGGG